MSVRPCVVGIEILISQTQRGEVSCSRSHN
jgi:hypothetical protein